MRCIGNSLVVALACGLLLSEPSRSLANDTMAAFGAGGLQFQKTDELQMTSEELYLSPKEVRVTYIFRNLTNHDVKGTVAFPMPEISVAEMSESPHKFHKSYLDGDIFDFRIEAGGHLIKPEANIYAFVKDSQGRERDVTPVLRKYRLPVVDPEASYGSLDADAIKTLIAAGVLMDDDERHPLWSVRTTFHWDQVFPARQSIMITHRYRPVIGSDHLPGDISDKESRDYLAPWCLDNGFVSSVKALPADNNGNLLLAKLDYILKTGANWAGPVGHFKLEIDKAGADLVSLCPIPGLKLQRRGQSFVAEARQFTPTTDIKLLFVYRACDKAPCGLEGTWPGFPR